MHAIISPSGFQALMLCPGKPLAEKGLPDTANEYSAEGSAAHELAALALTSAERCRAYEGRIFRNDGFETEATPEFCDDVQVYVDAVLARVQYYSEMRDTEATLLVEQRVPIDHITGEKDAKGTADVLILATLPDNTTTLEVWDLKFGRGETVDAEQNAQLMMYALGALEEHSLTLHITEVRLNIHQPRLRAEPSEFVRSANELRVWGLNFATPAARTALNMHAGLQPPVYRAGEKQCRFCKAKATCATLERHVAEQVTGQFSDLTLENTTAAAKGVGDMDGQRLASLYPQLDLIDGFIRAVRAKIEATMLAGGVVPGVKLVRGKRGNRKWSSTEQVEALCKKFRLRIEEMYDLTLVSPTKLEKQLAESPRRWAQVEPLITQSEGALAVAAEGDKRPAVVVAPVGDAFADVSTGELV